MNLKHTCVLHILEKPKTQLWKGIIDDIEYGAFLEDVTAVSGVSKLYGLRRGG